MSFSIQDFRPSSSDPEPDRDALLTTVLEAVAFCVYDQRKVVEIFEHVTQRVYDKHSIRIYPSVQWNPPTVHVSRKEDLIYQDFP